jgi:hypothetical protein
MWEIKNHKEDLADKSFLIAGDFGLRVALPLNKTFPVCATPKL